MSKSSSTFITIKSLKISLLISKILRNLIIQKSRKLNNKDSVNTEVCGLIMEEFNLEPIPDEMRTYRKGFTARSMDEAEEFDQIVNYGYGAYNEDNATELCYTLKISLTPGHIRAV
ncbi:hypothetical protein CONCODRAFT_72290 [Conidiobolus coronatus NRRL 28638]|uniref:Uncharacterized protein n=1 Tax=Conidiobolus coronatus (strain ATCC 28846 / CBS 209.66 / NRRL 28638) TaxID=796925 RepID=A0A137P0H2_CONC2|nr:hypothetical protein CONCODRAFT_72290 [Conidiobolus coronatus NRRL 28638]|eukprot:KXN68359.1 hypothetical protein CONCODRAFT_72290 [Conidiobolus coronatus NRRL 28638]